MPKQRGSRIQQAVAPLTPAEARRWAQGGLAFSLGPNQVLLYEGHRPFGVYVLLQGRLRCLSLKAGRVRLVGEAAAPVVVGRRLLRQAVPSPVRVQTVGASRVAFLAPAAVALLEAKEVQS